MVTSEPESAFRGFTKPIAAPLETLCPKRPRCAARPFSGAAPND
jgi:hypothetical protein